MNQTTAPVYTLKGECQDCYKCLRVCAVQAIRVLDGRADIVPSRCLSCGRCVSACPSHAKRVRNDVGRVRNLLGAGPPVVVSLAPSWRGALGLNRPRVIAGLKALGFTEVSETALGAEEVSIRTAAFLNQSPPGLYISSACPVIVDYIRLYKPEFTKNITPFASPALTHARLLKKHYGPDTRVVFIGPCIAKKNEADRHPELLDAALTFEGLKNWMREDFVDTDNLIVDEEASFGPERAHEGVLYPLDGGMSETIRRSGLKDEIQLMSISSLDLFAKALKGLDPSGIVRPIFVEALACVGGCLSGPCISSARSNFLMMSDLLRHVPVRNHIPLVPRVLVDVDYQPENLNAPGHTLEEIREALNRIGKFTAEDEMNCSGCGYQSCQDLARALLDGDAEPSMCVSYMRRLATRKAAAMVKAMPSAMVMVDKDLNILEVNEAFIRMFTGGGQSEYLGQPELLAGTPVEDWVDFSRLMKRVLKTGQDIHKEHFLYKKRLYDIHIFSVEQSEIIGAIVTDVTISQAGREKMAQKAREVIRKNISTVQEIACLLGEHMVETEVILSAIAADYDEDEADETEEPSEEESILGGC